MQKIVSMALAVVLLTGVGAPMAQAAASPHTDTAYNVKTSSGIVTEQVGNVRIQVLSPTLIRLEEKGKEGFEDRNTFHIVNRTEWQGDTVTRSETREAVTLTTSQYKVVIPAEAKDLSEIEIYDAAGNRVWRYNKIDTNKTALPDLTEYVEAWAIADTPRMVPPEWGFNLQPEDNRENREYNGWDLSNDAEDYYVFLPAGDHKQLRKDFVNLTGRTEMLPLYAFGAWDSRYYAYTEETALGQIDGYHSRDLPLDVLVVDTDWRDSSGGTGYNINTKLFPDMERFLSSAHDKNTRVIFNDHPEPTKTGDVQNNVLNPTEVSFRQQNLTRILKMGLDGWWYDRNWWTTIVPPDGYTHEVMGMATYAAAQKAVYPEERLFMMSNVDGINNGARTGSSNIAAHRYGIQWTGDTSGGQETIWQEVANAVNMGIDSALPYVSTDLGTHNTYDADMTNTEYLRWMQFGALSPIFRPHVRNVTDINDGRMPWVRGEETTDIYRDYINLRYRLLPVFYQLSHENYETGMPMLRSLAFDYPEYAAAGASDQYMLGEDILVAPVVDGHNAVIPADWFENLTAEYFNNMDLSGEPVLTDTPDHIDFDWGDGSPDSSIQSDQFSIRYTGELTIQSDTASKIALLGDDGYRLWIDDELVIDAWKPQDSVQQATPQSYAAGSKHTFRLEYFEEAYNAKIKVSFMSEGSDSAQRSVWIPEGEWINTLTGKTVYGPQTIQLSCKVDEYPIFIKKGAIIPLADETLTTADSDWSHLTLDVYPSTSQSDITQLYEDDTQSTRYEQGEYRTTELSSYFDSDAGEAVVQIGKAQGDFQGTLAFDSRDYTLRIHQPEGWGTLQKVLVDGQDTAFQTIAADRDAMPLDNQGGARDGAVYSLSLSAAVKQGATIRLLFADPADPQRPDAPYDTPLYFGKPTPVTVDRDIQVEESVPQEVNLTQEGSADWIHAGYDRVQTLVRKADVEPKICFKDADSTLPMFDYKAHMTWNDGDIKTSVDRTQTGSQNKGKGDGYEVIVEAGPGQQTLVLYLGGWCSTARMDVFDEAGSTMQSYEWSNSTDSFYRRVSITFSADRPSPLHIRYSLIDGDNNVFVAAALSGDMGELENELYMNAGNYKSGHWASQTVKIGLSSGQPDQVEKYQVRENEGQWIDLYNGEYRAAENGVYDLQFRFVDTAGKESEPQSVQIKKDSVRPILSLQAQKNPDGTVSLTPTAGEQLSGCTIYCAVDGGSWMPLAQDTLILSADDTSIYRFKAVSGAGIESTLLACTAADAEEPVIPPEILPGDLDGDEKITIADVMEACKVLARKAADLDPSDLEILRGDLDMDGDVTIADVMEICKILARKE